MSYSSTVQCCSSVSSVPCVYVMQFQVLCYRARCAWQWALLMIVGLGLEAYPGQQHSLCTSVPAWALLYFYKCLCKSRPVNMYSKYMMCSDSRLSKFKDAMQLDSLLCCLTRLEMSIMTWQTITVVACFVQLVDIATGTIKYQYCIYNIENKIRCIVL